MLRLILVAAALFLLLIPHATAQTSLALLKSDPARYFPAVKTAMQVVYDRTEKKQPYHGKTEKKQPYHGKIDLDACTERKMFLSEAYDGADPLEFNAVDVAYLMVFWSNDLRRLGYPATVWQSLFDDFEQKALPMLVDIAAKTSSRRTIRQYTGSKRQRRILPINSRVLWTASALKDRICQSSFLAKRAVAQANRGAVCSATAPIPDGSHDHPRF